MGGGSVEDRLDVAAVLLAYGSSLDEGDWDRLATCFTADARAVLGGPPGVEGVEAIVSVCRDALSAYEHTQHLIGPPEVTVDGDEAHLRANVQATHVTSPANVTVGGVYRDRLVRTPDGWRIDHHELQVLWMA